MCLIHGSTIPTTLSLVLGFSNNLPPLSMVLLVWTGLGLFLFNAIKQHNTLYIASNSIGFFLNTILLALIVFPWG